jgi:hypothetical protein
VSTTHQVQIDHETYQAIMRLKEIEQRNIKTLIARAVEAYAAKRKKEKP